MAATQIENLCRRWTTLTPEQKAHAESRPMWTRQIGFEAVAPATDALGERTGHAVAAALGLPVGMLKIAWIQPCDPDHPDAVGPVGAGLMGLASQRDVGLILVRADQSLAMTERIIAHELRHVWQLARGVAFSSSEDREADAERFASEWMEATA